MTSLSPLKPTLSPLPMDESGSDLDQSSRTSQGTTEEDYSSIGSSYHEKIMEVSREGKFFENDLSEEEITDAGVIAQHHPTPHLTQGVNEYIDSIDKVSGLFVKKPIRVKTCTEKGPLYLFFLCFRKDFIQALMLTATNCNLASNGLRECTFTEIKAYIGIEILISVLGIRRIKNLWSKTLFLGNIVIKCTMSRDRYYQICRNLGIGTFINLDSKVKHQDP